MIHSEIAAERVPRLYRTEVDWPKQMQTNDKLYCYMRYNDRIVEF